MPQALSSQFAARVAAATVVDSQRGDTQQPCSRQLAAAAAVAAAVAATVAAVTPPDHLQNSAA